MAAAPTTNFLGFFAEGAELLLGSGFRSDRERRSVLECTWHWPEKPGAPVKFWVLTRHLSMVVQSAGLYSVGLYDSLDATEPVELFPLPVVRFNPLIPPSTIALGLRGIVIGHGVAVVNTGRTVT